MSDNPGSTAFTRMPDNAASAAPSVVLEMEAKGLRWTPEVIAPLWQFLLIAVAYNAFSLGVFLSVVNLGWTLVREGTNRFSTLIR
jgi:hypothetical protein